MGDVDAYIQKFPAETRARLEAVRAIMGEVAPQLTEQLKWGKIGYSSGTIMVVIAGYTHHVGLHLTNSTVAAFAGKLKSYTIGASSVQLPNDRPLPDELIRALVRYRIKEYDEHGVLWR